MCFIWHTCIPQHQLSKAMPHRSVHLTRFRPVSYTTKNPSNGLNSPLSLPPSIALPVPSYPHSLSSCCRNIYTTTYPLSSIITSTASITRSSTTLHSYSSYYASSQSASTSSSNRSGGRNRSCCRTNMLRPRWHAAQRRIRTLQPRSKAQRMLRHTQTRRLSRRLLR